MTTTNRTATSTIPASLEPLFRAYVATFLNRTTPYARQRDDGSYRWIVQPSDDPVLGAHLAGKQTIAVSCLDEEGKCRWACLDADGEDGLAQLLRVRGYFAKLTVPSILEASRRGGHLWLLFAEPVPATIAREVTLPLLESLRSEALPLDHLDLYPDSDRVGALGHAVRLPLGVHRLSGKRYPFLDEQGQPLPLAKLPDALEYLAEAPRISLDVLEDLHERLAPYVAGTEFARHDDDRSDQDTPPISPTYSTRSEVMRWVDAHVSPLDLLDEFVPTSELHRAGQGWIGWCPFHDDHDDHADQEDGSPGTPSLYVVHNDRYGWSWQCLSSNCAHAHGPMRHSFRLFQELLGLDAKAAIRAALERWPDESRERHD